MTGSLLSIPVCSDPSASLAAPPGPVETPTFSGLHPLPKGPAFKAILANPRRSPVFPLNGIWLSQDVPPSPLPVWAPGLDLGRCSPAELAASAQCLETA